MNQHSKAQLIAAPFLGTVFLLASCDQFLVRDCEEEDNGSTSYPTLGATPYPLEHDLPNPKLLETSWRVAREICESADHPLSARKMRPYDLETDRTGEATMKMLVIPGGEFTFGSDTKGEGPPCRVRLDPFWMAETEVTWAFYRVFQESGINRNRDGTLTSPDRIFHPLRKTADGRQIGGHWGEPGLVDVISQPTPQYHDLFLSGELPNGLDYPAMCMTHHAASKFCQWLSAQTGHFYRLPTEAEWEYACRAGAKGAYHFGDDRSLIDKYAWHAHNSDYTYHLPKQKKPNAWGLHDMHGNVAEWVLDGFAPLFRGKLHDGVRNPWRIPFTRYPRIAKGGSWDHEIEELRVTARTLSTKDWLDSDPIIPRSIWYCTDSQHIGFRIVRPLQTPSPREMHLFWNTDWYGVERNMEDL